jgi:uncharacterized protein
MTTQPTTADPGRFNRLRILRQSSIGLYLDGLDLGDILLPRRYVPATCAVGDEIEVFLYYDSDDRIIATTERPLAAVGELAYLQVVAVNDTGAFVDWGLPKDLLIPFREQLQGLYRGRRCIVYIYCDPVSRRLVGSTKLNKHLAHRPIPYQAGDAVQLVVCDRTELGYRVIVDRQYLGLIYDSEIFQPLADGQSVPGFIKAVRPDGKIDAALQAAGSSAAPAPDLAHSILQRLQQAGGFLPFNDNTPPDLIYSEFHVSKKVFKRCIGQLYKQRRITIEQAGIRSV